jgi:hypothetical protein
VPTWRLVGFFLFFFFFICQKTKTPPKGKNSREFFSDVRSEEYGRRKWWPMISEVWRAQLGV